MSTAATPAYTADPFTAGTDGPFRGELLGPDHLDELARDLATRWPTAAKPSSRSLLRRLRENGHVLRRARDEAAAGTAAKEPLTPDAEWLLDNFYVIEEVLREVQTDLPADYYDELPAVAAGPWAGLPRVYALAVALISHTDSHLDDGQILRFVKAFQEGSPLTTGEIWAVPTMLRLALLENLRRLAAQMLTARFERAKAASWIAEARRTGTATPLPDYPTDAFLVAWHTAMRDRAADVPAGPAAWVARHAAGLSDVLRREHRRQAANQVSVGNCVMSLRLLNAVDWAVFFESASPVEEVLRAEPTGTYARQEFATRDRYRQKVELLAKASRRSEVEVARLAIERSEADPRKRHLGYWLIGEGRSPFAAQLGCRFGLKEYWRLWAVDHPHAVFFGLLAAFTLSGVVAAALGASAAGAGPLLVAVTAVLAVLPASELAVGLTNYLVTQFLPPRALPKLDFQKTGIPPEWRTVVVIPSLLTKPESGPQLAARLELHYLANPDPELRFALLTDWADAATETTPADEALLRPAAEAIRALNAKYAAGGPDKFFLFHRRRLYNPAEGVWMGWERKRGKLDEFNRLLRGATDTSYVTRSGDAAAIGAKFVLTLDADTVLPRDSARRLVATLAHPLNRPVLSPDGRRVVAGYGVLQPRVSFLFRTGLRSRFARTFAWSAGIDPYSAAISDVYQDLFGWGTFTGKGLYDVDAFAATAGHAFPENAILSHDLIESNFARCGLATDVELFDDFPAKYHAYAKREHRWIRGDWQLLPWLGRTVPTPDGPMPNALSTLAKWKVFDNLRRSLVAPGLVAFLVVAWLALPGAWLAWSLAALAVVGLPLGLQLFEVSRGILRSRPNRALLTETCRNLGTTAAQVALSAAFLANQAYLAVDAIARTLYRLYVSRRRLLEWETAAAAEARLGADLGQFLRSMGVAAAVGAGLAGALAAVNPAALPAALPWLAAWALSPVIAWWVSRPLPDREPQLTPAEVRELRRIARKTWRFFETFVTEEDHWLPPDNFQEDPKGVVAHRTSPTNKGLSLIATLNAHDLGYVTLPEVVDRLGKSFDTFDKLKRHRGHFLNWYDTVTLEPLPPAYVSTVDSGNLLACLLVAKHGLLEKQAEPIPSPALAEGLRDATELAAEQFPPGTVAAFREHLSATPANLTGWRDWLVKAEDIVGRWPTPTVEGVYWVGAVSRQLREVQAELDALCPWVNSMAGLQRSPVKPYSLDRWPALLADLDLPRSVAGWATRLPALREELAAWAKGIPQPGHEAHAEVLLADSDRSRAGELAAALDALARRADSFADAMDFRFLYNENRHLFSIGYNVPLERLDPAHYDLLASESCIASFLAVARGSVPRKHWFQLGRLTTLVAGRPGLISWGGTMFEYLMPRLVLTTIPGTLLDGMQRAAVARQVEYGRQNGVPWGISESGFHVLSADGDYQYQSFGVPGLGLKRGLARDLVIAPYATLLAVAVEPKAAVANFAALRQHGGEGPHGFYEAIDFTPDRVAKGKRCEVVKSYMAHHQGMGFCAIAGRVTGDRNCRRLRAEPAVRAAELLLQERVPVEAQALQAGEAETESSAGGPVQDAAVSRRLTRADTPAPRSQLLSNGHYTVMVTNAGGGFSTCRGLAVTRWRNDPTRDHYGTFLYIRDADSGRAWSAGHQPLGGRADSYEVIFSADKAEFHRRDGQIETHLEIAVAPDRDVEVRRLTLINHGTTPRVLEVTSYAEVALIDPRADLAHPAFGKLFLETEFHPQYDALVCRRRPRSPDERPVHAVHAVAADPFGTAGGTQFETDRAKFLGRRRTPANPESLTRPLSGTVGPVLDPIFALRKTAKLPPGTTVTLAFATAVVGSREEAVGLADHYRGLTGAARAFELAWAHSRVELRDLGISAADSHLFQRLAGHVLFPPPALRSASGLKANRQGQPGLWKYGISGDLPILLVALADADGMALALQAVKAHSFWRSRGFAVDLVLLADRPGSYREELYDDLCAYTRAADCRDVIDKPGGVFVRKASQFADDDRMLLMAAARVVLYGDRGTLGDQTDALARGWPVPAQLVPTRPHELRPLAEDRSPTAAGRSIGPDEPEHLLLFNGTGGFTPDGREYVIVGTPPAPWSNVIANPAAGCLVTDSGLACTWVGNSQANRLTPWGNDPVSDPSGEVVYLRDDETGEIWTPTPLPAGGVGRTIVRHGAGYTTFGHHRDDISSELTAFVPVADPVKVLRLTLRNSGERPRKLAAGFYAEWVLGTTRDATTAFIVTETDPTSGALLARNSYNADFGTSVAFADCSLRPRSLTADRTEFLGRNRSPADPAALHRVELSGRVGPGLDPCAALLGKLELAPGGEAVVVFVIGQANSVALAAALAEKYRDPAAASAALAEAVAAWDHRLSAVTVRTPDPALDLMVNRWLPYQVLSCRFWGRTAFYQSGGAYGFRDQLQDAMALLYSEPGEARAHILRAATRQFIEGDVQHWWHPPSDRGVRTRFSDDFLWLPYAAARYAEVTGDAAIFDEVAHYLRGPALAPEQHEAYFLPDVTAEAEPLYAHCLRALDRGWALGPHGLPLMGGGDWNDGMNLVGVLGRGESVWVAWFQIVVRAMFANVAHARGDAETARKLRAQVDQLRQAVETHAWDGRWYLRAWFDDGTPLGSATNDECQIDSLPQTWAVLAGVADPGRAAQAVESAVMWLVDKEHRIVKLFAPPFNSGALQPGYVKGYVPGIRENGGQYTHAAIWLVQALAELGRADEAYSLWSQLNPLSHSATPEKNSRYLVEPYVVSADVYGVVPHVGRGGWTWYTGSAAWLYRAALETLLGFSQRGNELRFAPRIPSGWDGYEVRYRYGSAVYHCRIEQPSGPEKKLTAQQWWLDGEPIAGPSLLMKDDGSAHEVRIVLGQTASDSVN